MRSPRFLPLLFGVVLLSAGCDSAVDHSPLVPEPKFETASKYVVPWEIPASLGTVTFATTQRSLLFKGSALQSDGTTAFTYEVTPSLRASGYNNDFVWIELPECVAVHGSQATKVVPVNGSRYFRFPVQGGNVAFTETILTTLATGGLVPEGITQASVSVDNTSPSALAKIVGPSCEGFPTMEITAFVYLDRDPPGEGGPNGRYDTGEPGIGGVAVELWSNEGKVGTDFSDANARTGEIVFQVPHPDLYPDGEAPSYSLYLDGESGGINKSLFPGVVMKSIGEAMSYGPVTGSGPHYFGFQVDVQGAIAKFESGTATTKGLPRAYWRVQGSGKGNPNYNPDMTTDNFASLLNCVAAEPFFNYFDGRRVDFTCIENYGNPLFPSFGADDLTDRIFEINGSAADRLAALEILKTSSTNNANEALRTQILTALLNYAVGNRIDLGSDTSEEADRAAMKVIIQNAMYVLLNDGGYTIANKIGEGSVGTNTTLLTSVNGG